MNEETKCEHDFEGSEILSNCCGANIPMYPDMDIRGDCHEHCAGVRSCNKCGEEEEND